MDLSSAKLKMLQDFTKKNKALIEEYAEKSTLAYLELSKKYTEEMYSTNLVLIDGVTNDNEQQLAILENLFKNLTQTRGQCKHNQRVAYSLGRKQYMSNLLKNFFIAWNKQTIKQKYLHRMRVKADTHAKIRLPRQIFTKWRKHTRDQIREGVRIEISKKTEHEILLMQREYENLIAQLEAQLENKQLELKVEAEHHKELVNRYDSIVEKRTSTFKH